MKAMASDEKTMKTNSKNRITRRLQKGSPLLKGMRDAIPIGMGYYAVSFSLGIIAVKAGLTAPLGFLSSFFTRASAGD